MPRLKWWKINGRLYPSKVYVDANDILFKQTRFGSVVHKVELSEADARLTLAELVAKYPAPVEQTGASS